MKETTCWKCDICGTEYKDKKKCEQCEAGHKKKGKIVKMRHLPYTSYPSGYPDKKRCIACKLNMPAGRLPANMGY